MSLSQVPSRNPQLLGALYRAEGWALLVEAWWTIGENHARDPSSIEAFLRSLNELVNSPGLAKSCVLAVPFPVRPKRSVPRE